MMKMKLANITQMANKKILISFMSWWVLACGGLLFMPAKILLALSLTDFVTLYADFIGLGLIVGVAYFLSQLLSFFVDESIVHLNNKRSIEIIEAKVKLLDPAERALLREFFLQGATILTLPQDELAVKCLVDTQILEVVGNVRHYAIQGPTADYKITMRARVYLNRDVLRLPAGEPSKEELSNLIKARPQFASGLVQQRKHAA
ncbi:superinfection exclusion B family protein [Shewanella sp. SR44-3]|uniref:superinfection exclusion B family protein n=1 Tax=unclassified Shewanella TaxID=196818 RepID=UPI0015FC5A97|nr:superinfection exclusion B family protein [Shewanella sp. SR44-3]MBB1268221.1 superinfection exclusion B family protein [Shewanella sp. SR44-3]